MQRYIFFVLISILSVNAIHFTKRDASEMGFDVGLNNACWMDLNNDGWLDIFMGQGFINNHDNTFTKYDSCTWDGGRRIAQADINGDTLPDILTMQRLEKGVFTLRLYINQGPPDYKFIDISKIAGIRDTFIERDLVDIGWLDIDNDGALDFYITSYEYPANSATGHEDYLFHNRGDNTFENISDSSGITSLELCSRGLSFSDFDMDGDVDIYVSVYRLQPNILWLNNGDLTFTNVALERGVAGTKAGGSYGHNIGACWGDVDNDGDMDIFTPITHHSGYPGDPTNHLWINSGAPDWSFTDMIENSGLESYEIGSSPSWVDFDNDGDLDLYYVNLYGAPFAGGWLYENKGAYKFEDVTENVGLIKYNRRSFSLWADFNNDGFMDVLISRYDGVAWHHEFFINSADNNNHYVEVDLRSKNPNNTFGIGAKIFIYADTLTLLREVLHNAGNNYGNPFYPRQHFGLGKNEKIDSLIIIWPSGTKEIYTDLQIDKLYKFNEGYTGINEYNQGKNSLLFDAIKSLSSNTYISLYTINGELFF